MNHEDGCRREEFENVVTVADRIQTVRIDALEVQPLRDKGSIDWQCRSCKSACAERHDVRPRIYPLKPLKITHEHTKVRHKVMSKKDGLSTLQVRIPRHDDILVRRR